MDQEKMERYIGQVYSDENRLRSDKWSYDDACLLLGAIQMYRATRKEEFREAVLRYADHYVSGAGDISTYRPEDFKLDDILGGRILLFALEETGEPRYQRAVEGLLNQLERQPRTGAGSYWHKKIYPNQVWLDGLFMAQPFRMAYDTKYGKRDKYIDILDQFYNARETLRDPKTGLYHHGYDESRSVFWADPDTGRSGSFWLRGIGWYLMALADTVEEMDRKVYDCMRPLQDIYKEAVRGLLAYADKQTGLFYQVVDRPDLAGNYLETSGSAMAAASIFKACRLRLILMEKYRPAAEKILDTLTRERLVERDGRLVLTGTCQVAGLGPEKGRRDGSPEYYLSEPVRDDDNKGTGAAVMAYAQYLLLKKWETGVRWKA